LKLPLRNEKVKVLSAIQPMKAEDVPQRTVRAQYEGYRKEKGVNPQSMTATYAAVRLQIDNWRWQGVPFYLRSGKNLKEKLSQISIEFKEPPHLLFPKAKEHMTPNMLVLYLQPDEGMHLRFEAKVPDTIADALGGYGIPLCGLLWENGDSRIIRTSPVGYDHGGCLAVHTGR
jgi:glucose-6-phosphate 1-dehydrogenase